MPTALEYNRYPMWLNHQSRAPVIVYDTEQEAEYLAKGYTAPGTADPHAYLVAKVSDKLDDRLRAIEKRVDEAIKTGLLGIYSTLSARIEERFNRLHRGRAEGYEVEDCDVEDCDAVLPEMKATISEVSKSISESAMDALRDIAESTRYDG